MWANDFLEYPRQVREKLKLIRMAIHELDLEMQTIGGVSYGEARSRRTDGSALERRVLRIVERKNKLITRELMLELSLMYRRDDIVDALEEYVSEGVAKPGSVEVAFLMNHYIAGKTLKELSESYADEQSVRNLKYRATQHFQAFAESRGWTKEPVVNDPEEIIKTHAGEYY